jgi:hypothetical protein
MEELRYPVGRFEAPTASATPDEWTRWVDEIERFPEALARAVAGLDEAALDTPYRDGGWTVRQVVHHLADSHVNGFIRTKNALADDKPTIGLYDQDAWTAQVDASTLPPEFSLRLLGGLHTRWTLLLRSLGEEAWRRPLVHPDWGEIDLAVLVALYAWHCRHHVAHIEVLRRDRGWGR